MRSTRMTVSLILLVVLVVSGVTSQPMIKVNLPTSLAAQYPSGITERPAMFGVPSYATSIYGRLIWATNGVSSCHTFDATTWPRGQPWILLIDRGDCSFVQKVRLAQEQSAVAAIIVDNVDEPGLPFMADDGTGSTIAIPSALIHKSDGAIIKASINAGDLVTVTLSWSLPRPDNRVEYDLWTSSIDEPARSWKNNWKRAAVALDVHAKYTPRYWIYDGEAMGCRTQPCANQCMNKNRYCSNDPDQHFDSGISGADVVKENLNQMCLYRYLNRTNYNDMLFWDYVQCFQTQCYPTRGAIMFNDTCSARCVASIGVTWSVITDCIAAAGGVGAELDQRNTLLEEDMYLRPQQGIFSTPTMLVNLTPYRGSLQCPAPIDVSHCGPLAMICQGFQEGTKPAACVSSPGCWPGELRDGCDVCGGNNGTCADCLGEPYGTATVDIKGTCCAASVRDTCNICHGPGADSCNQCYDKTDTRYMDPKLGGLDACGTCLKYSAPEFNNSGCIGCDGIAKSGKVRDVCGVCGGGEQSPKNCPGYSSVSVGVIIGISIACVAVAALGVFIYMRRQQNVLKNDIDSLLKQYLPLDAANSLAHSDRAQHDGYLPTSAPAPHITTPNDL